MSLHYLADLFLCLFHAAEIAEPFRWYIANDFDRFWCRSLNRAANGRRECSIFVESRLEKESRRTKRSNR